MYADQDLDSLKLVAVFTLLTCSEDAPGPSCLLFLILDPAMVITTISVIEPGTSHRLLKCCLLGVTQQA